MAICREHNSPYTLLQSMRSPAKYSKHNLEHKALPPHHVSKLQRRKPETGFRLYLKLKQRYGSWIPSIVKSRIIEEKQAGIYRPLHNSTKIGLDREPLIIL